MNKKYLELQLDDILEKAVNRQLLTTAEIINLLDLRNENDLEKLYGTARRLKERYFDNKIFLYGFVYFSTWCRNNCNFCYFRKSNDISHRYRKTEAEILEVAKGLADAGVHLIDLTMGEDPFYHMQKSGLKPLGILIEKVKKHTGLPVMVSPGVVTDELMSGFADVGTDWYACYQETFNMVLFRKLRPNQSFNRRLLGKKLAIQAGMLIEEGILTGVGETQEDIALSIENMRVLGAHQVRVMTFVPHPGIPMEKKAAANNVNETTVIAVLRLLFPDRLIPASLDVDGIEGLQARLNAGANVITSLIPPQMGLAGVAQSTKDIDEGYRTVQGVSPILEQMGLRIAAKEEYLKWINVERQKLNPSLSGINVYKHENSIS